MASVDFPKIEVFFIPVLQSLCDGKERMSKDLVEAVANAARLTGEQRIASTTNGTLKTLNRIAWAEGRYLVPAGLLRRVRKSCYQITEEGKNLLSENLISIDHKFLKERYPSYANSVLDRRTKKP